MLARSATNAHWYVDNTYIVLTLQKLVDLGLDQEGSDFDLNDKLLYSLREGKNGHNGEWFSKAVHNSNETPVVGVENQGCSQGPIGRLINREWTTRRQTQYSRKRGWPSAERVSIFLTADNTVISFFESSADDIEIPILNRLSTTDTILRQLCDAAMITQGIVDAIIDLTIPVTNAYKNAICELEHNVLIQPSSADITSLYTIMSEVSSMRSSVLQIADLINSLRYYKP